MEIDVERYLGAVTRSVTALEREGKPARKVTLARTYDTSVEDLWDAVSNPERIPRWFLPVSGEFRRGGRYQLQGNAGGEILVCDAPGHLGLTWEFGGDVSWVNVRLKKVGAGARLALEHVAHVSEHWEKYGPGAVGIGWDIALMGLALHITTRADRPIDEATWAVSENGKAFGCACAEDWRRAAVAGGENAASAKAAAARTAAFYTGEAPPD